MLGLWASHAAPEVAHAGHGAREPAGSLSQGGTPSRVGGQALGMALCQCSPIAPAQCGDGLTLWASACQQQLATSSHCMSPQCTPQRGRGFPCHAVQVPDSVGCEMSLHGL